MIMKKMDCRGMLKNMKILDVGCGNRKLRGAVGVDIDSNSQADCVCDAIKLPFHDSSFDLVYSAYTIQHIRDQEKVIEEMRRVLKPNGKIVIKTASIFAYLIYNIRVILSKKAKRYSFARFYTKKSLRLLLEKNGFKNVKVKFTRKNWGSYVGEGTK